METNKTMLQQLAERMDKEVVHFRYAKKNGEIREVHGTLIKDLCPKTEGTGRPTPEHLQLYYDVKEQSYKTFIKNNLIEIL